MLSLQRGVYVAMNRQLKDYLWQKISSTFFEAMIDTLVSGKDKQKFAEELTEQRDGKSVDHMFVGQAPLKYRIARLSLLITLGIASIINVPRMTHTAWRQIDIQAIYIRQKCHSNGNGICFWTLVRW